MRVEEEKHFFIDEEVKVEIDMGDIGCDEVLLTLVDHTDGEENVDNNIFYEVDVEHEGQIEKFIIQNELDEDGRYLSWEQVCVMFLKFLRRDIRGRRAVAGW